MSVRASTLLGATAATAALIVAGCLPALPAVPEGECEHASYEPNPCAASDSAPWPMFHRDARHTAISPTDASASGTVDWTFETGGELHASPVVGPDGTIYIGSHDRGFYALDPAGNLRWSLVIGETHSTAAIRRDGVIYRTTEELDDSALIALNPDGTVRWRYATGGENHGGVTISENGTVYICSHDGKLHAVGGDSKPRWTVDIGECHSSPAIGDDGTIYVGSEETGTLYAVRVDGVILWEHATGGAIESSPAIGSDGTIYFGSADTKLYAVDPFGAELWAFETGGPIVSSPAILPGRSAGGEGCLPGVVVIGSRDGRLYAVSRDGEEIWRYQTGDAISYASPAVGANAMTYIGSRDGSLYAINCDGALIWQVATGGPISSSSPAITADGTVLVGSDDGTLYAIGG